MSGDGDKGLFFVNMKILACARMQSLLRKNSLFYCSIASVCFVLSCWTSPDILHVASCLPHARRARHPLPLAVGAHVNPPEEGTQSRGLQSYNRALKDARSINIKTESNVCGMEVEELSIMSMDNGERS